jgi:Leucine-rich repeat (LRR) protein
MERRRNNLTKDYEKVITKLGISNFILRIGYVSHVLRIYHVPIVELSLEGTLITASECLVLATIPQISTLQRLNLSSNPITILGLLHLLDPRVSELRQLTHLRVVDCDIDQAQTYMVSNDRLENTRAPFKLTHLNLSHNKLSHFLNYCVELDLIN